MTDPFTRHRSEVEDVLASAASPGEIKALYRRFGDYLEESAPADVRDVPVLSYPETARLVARAVPFDARTVLDAGCGPNPAVTRLLLGRATVVALDIAEGNVRLARAIAASEGHALAVVVGDLEALPFRTGSFDALVCDDTIEHVPDDRLAAGELARVVTPGGTAVVATPNRNRPGVLVRLARDRLRGRPRPRRAYYAAESHLREYSRRDLRRLLAVAFRTVRIEPRLVGVFRRVVIAVARR